MNTRNPWTVTTPLFAILSVLTLLTAGSLFAEEIRLTTYYPSPFGEYDQLESNNLVVYGDVLLATVAGRVGIGTTGPLSMLDIAAATATMSLSSAGSIDLYLEGSSNDNKIDSRRSNDLLFQINSATKMTLDGPTGNVGIGTTGPGAPLHVKRGSDGMVVKFEGPTDSYIYAGTDSSGAYIESRDTTASQRKLRLQSFDGTSYYQQLFIDAQNQRVYVPSGNVGIGTTGPGAKLDVQGQIIGGFGAQTTGGTLDWNDTSNTRSGSGYTLLRGSHTNGPGPGTYFHPFNFEYSSKNGGGNMTQLAIPYGATGHMNSGLYMRGRYSGAWSNWMRILAENNSGNVGIGTVSPGFKLDVAGAVHGSSFPTSSDAQFKANVTPIVGALAKLSAIQGVSFNWNETYQTLGRATPGRQLGLIAQEVEAVLPELVTTWGPQGYRAVDYGRLSAVLIEAIKEQQGQLKAQATQLEQLQVEFAALQARL